MTCLPCCSVPTRASRCNGRMGGRRDDTWRRRALSAPPHLQERELEMSVMTSFFSGAINGLVNGASKMKTKLSAGGACDCIERFCAELGWPVDERDGNYFRLNIGKSESQRRN